MNIVHRELACKNVLVTDGKILKIAEFGLARTTEYYVSREVISTGAKWMAPEAIRDRIFTEKSDVYVCVYVCVCVCVCVCVVCVCVWCVCVCVHVHSYTHSAQILVGTTLDQYISICIVRHSCTLVNQYVEVY